MSLNSRKDLQARFRRGKSVRERFVESHLGKGIAFQLRATRDRKGWSQDRLAAESGMTQNAISRLESAEYGKPTITTLRRLAAAMDVGLIVRFVPFSELADWISGTPRVNMGLSADTIAIPSFPEEEEQQGRAIIKCLTQDAEEKVDQETRISTLPRSGQGSLEELQSRGEVFESRERQPQAVTSQFAIGNTSNTSLGVAGGLQ